MITGYDNNQRHNRIRRKILDHQYLNRPLVQSPATARIDPLTSRLVDVIKSNDLIKRDADR